MKLPRVVCSITLAFFVSFSGQAATGDSLAAVGTAPRPAPPLTQPVTETMFGMSVTDKYRAMEALDFRTLAWIKAQGAYTRAVLNAIKPLSALAARVGAFTGSFGLIQDYASYGGRAFYQERTPGSDDFDLMVRDGRDVHKIIDIAALRTRHGGEPYAINYILPAPDGSKVAVGVSEGGSEAALLYVYDVASNTQIAGPIDRAQFGATAWSNDSGTLFFVRGKQVGPNDPATEKYRDPTLDAWTLKSPPAPLLGATTRHGPAFAPDEAPTLTIAPGASAAALSSLNGVQNELKLWLAPVAQAANPAATWTQFVDRDDGVTAFDMRGDEIFLLSHKNAPTFQVLGLKAGEALASAHVLIAAEPGRVIESVHAAADALYVATLTGAYSHLLRIPTGTTRVEEVALPTEGHLGEIFTDPRKPGLTIELSSWVTPPTRFAYDPASHSFADLKLGVHGDIKPAQFVVSDLQAKARDGVMVPLSLIRPAAAKGPQITVVEGYGAYGISELADFSPRRAAMMREGIAYTLCHVRGGGELGDAWRLAGKDANKHNSWEDLIACGQDLITRGLTTRNRLFILGGSAGGITVGRAMTERPDLFAGVIDIVPDANSLRAEFSPSGPVNIPEFGTVKTEQGLHNLYAMDSIQHVKPHVTYPAILISTGLNDPRASPWESAKFAAALEASGDPDPVLLRVDEQAGHGIGSTKTQGDLLDADWIAFVFWRAGKPGWRPNVSSP